MNWHDKPRCIIIWQQQCSSLSRRTWPHPSPGKFHISAPLPRFSAPLRSPDNNWVSQVPWHPDFQDLHEYHLLANSTPWICFSLLLKLDQCDHRALLTGIRNPPEGFQECKFSDHLLQYALRLTCISLVPAEPVTSRICDLCVCSCPSIPGSHWKNTFWAKSSNKIHSLLCKIFKDCEYCFCR